MYQTFYIPLKGSVFTISWQYNLNQVLENNGLKDDNFKWLLSDFNTCQYRGQNH